MKVTCAFPALAPWGMSDAAPAGRLYLADYPVREWPVEGEPVVVGKCIVRLLALAKGPGPRNALVERLHMGEAVERFVTTFYRKMRRVVVERQANLFEPEGREVE